MNTADDPVPTARLRAWLRAHGIDIARAENAAWPLGPHRVWRVTTTDGRVGYLKQLREARAFEQEHAAYLRWAPRLEPQVPRMLAVSDSALRALWLSEVPGRPLIEFEFDPNAREHHHEQAGRFLRRLHALPFRDDDPLPVPAALRQRTDFWCRRAAGLLPDDVLAWSRRAFDDDALFRDCSRVPCHRDYQPRNWLVTSAVGEEPFAVIDFEHARGDVALVDLVRLWVGDWRECPDLESAFARGYGRDVLEIDRVRLRALAVLWAVGTIVWGTRHDDVDFVHHGRRVLDELAPPL